MSSNQNIIDVRVQTPGTTIEHFFVVRRLDYHTKKDGGVFVKLELGNRFGRVQCVMWEPAADFRDTFQEGNIVKVRGKVTEYQNTKQITIVKIRNAVPEDGIEMEEFIAGYPGDLDELKDRLKEIIEEVGDPFIKNMLQRVFGNEDIHERYCRAPAGKLWHHAYLGGLLHHSLSLVDICLAVAQIHPSVNRDLLIAGSLLHDIGKIDELSSSGFVDYTDKGRLVGHIVLGSIFIDKILLEIPEFPEELRLRILHMILSHQGAPENDSPRVPMTLEGIILHYADELDSQANAFERIIEKEAREGKAWSDYVKLKGRYFFFGENKEIEPKNQ